MVTRMNGEPHHWSPDVLDGTRFGPLEYVAETGSTNADLMARAAEGEPPGVVLVADHQVAGRGRLDRAWETPPGTNLMMSMLVGPVADPGHLVLLTPALAVAVVDVLAGNGVEAGVKWPNDVLLAGPASGKLAGILAEAVDAETAVVGIGCNVGWPKRGAPAPPGATSLAAAGVVIDRWALLVEIVRTFDRRLTDLEAGDGPAGLRQAVLDVSLTVGRDVRVARPDGDLIGTAVDVQASGALVVEAADGIHAVMAGDVVQLRDA